MIVHTIRILVNSFWAGSDDVEIVIKIYRTMIVLTSAAYNVSRSIK